MQTDCFGCKDGKCVVLKKSKFRKNECNTECSFYKTHEQHREDLENHYASLAKLPKEQQEAISSKYYHSKMPWNKKESEEK